MQRRESGQALFLVILAMGIILTGAVGLAIDVSQLYAHTQMAQSAADAAALAGMLSVYDGTNTGAKNTFGTAEIVCKSTDTYTPCVFASKNGFLTASDTVTVDFPGTGPAAPVGVALSSDTVNWVKVTITRSVSPTFMRLVGAKATTTIKATATAAIVSVQSAVPLLITDPKDSNTLSGVGASSIVICGGPTQSVQVNSTSSSAYSVTVDLSHAGPSDPGTCTTGTGASFGVTGQEAESGISLGSTGHYLEGHSPIQDPLQNVCPVAAVAASNCATIGGPAIPAAAPAMVTIAKGVDGCTQSSCDLFSPGLYVGGLSIGNKNNPVIFKPGLYYIQGGGFDIDHDTGGGATVDGLLSAMCVGCAADSNTGTGMVVYDTGPSGNQSNAGGFTIGTQGQVFLQGSTITTTDDQGNTVPGPPYYGILFWEDRTANSNTHDLGHSATAAFAFSGTIYITNTLAAMINSNKEQTVEYNGAPSSTTIVQGNMIVGKFSMNGASTFKMFLNPYSALNVRQVSLVQ